MMKIFTIQIDKFSLRHLFSKYYRKHYLSTIEYNRCTLLLAIAIFVFKMYRKGTLWTETEVGNGIVAAIHVVICQTDNCDATKLPIKPVNLRIVNSWKRSDTSN